MGELGDEYFPVDEVGVETVDLFLKDVVKISLVLQLIIYIHILLANYEQTTQQIIPQQQNSIIFNSHPNADQKRYSTMIKTNQPQFLSQTILTQWLLRY